MRLPALAILLFGIGLVIAGLRRAGWRELPRGMAEVARHEWSLRRIAYIATGLITFYVCYVGYRNLKSVLPVYRQDVLFDNQLLDVDRLLFGGADPAAVLHTILPPDLTAPVSTCSTCRSCRSRSWRCSSCAATCPLAPGTPPRSA